MFKEGLFFELGQEGVYVGDDGGTVRNTLTGNGIEKQGGGANILKMGTDWVKWWVP